MSQLLDQNKLNAVFWNTASQAWNPSRIHSGVFLNKKENNIIQTRVSDTKGIAYCYLDSFENRKVE